MWITESLFVNEVGAVFVTWFLNIDPVDAVVSTATCPYLPRYATRPGPC